MRWRPRRRVARQVRQPSSGLCDQVQEAELGEHLGVPIGAGADETGQPAHTVGERPGAGVDEAGRQLVPGGVAGERRVGETGADPILQPPVELDQTLDHARHALVARAIELVAVGGLVVDAVGIRSLTRRAG